LDDYFLIPFIVVNHALSPEDSVTLYERMQTLHQESSNSIMFLWNFGQILLSTGKYETKLLLQVVWLS